MIWNSTTYKHLSADCFLETLLYYEHQYSDPKYKLWKRYPYYPSILQCRLFTIYRHGVQNWIAQLDERKQRNRGINGGTLLQYFYFMIGWEPLVQKMNKQMTLLKVETLQKRCICLCKTLSINVICSQLGKVHFHDSRGNYNIPAKSRNQRRGKKLALSGTYKYL